jgi:hypothetical protein
MKLNILLLSALSITLVLLHKECKTSLTLRQSTATEVKQWKDQAGFWRASSEIIQREKNALNSELNQLHQDYQKLVKSKRINSGTEITTETVREVVLTYDTINVLSFNDRWLQVMYEPDFSRLSLMSRDSISLVSYNKWNGLFKPRILTVEAVSHNPYTRVTGLRKVEFSQARRVAPVVYAGFGANQDGLGWQVGIGVGYRILK